ncbi:hypothetical protein [Chelatococcus asaccharovorans]|uniref:hypothetical protein n=1 Tax=Chelatococcus asaccharovorans TaxID=28210 RepID=UPI00224C7135|nr:hypothetical protein [Chelatococcus asaccharovorans]CAH1662804.1 conserved hypothetical protein [Chelatococcus asaccharovorans]CAH1683055.1 conserved hypothetical protein [Chelatococcus asaccharovorans]
MSEPQGSQGPRSQADFGRTGVMMLGAAVFLLAANFGMEGTAAASQPRAAISEPSSEVVLIQTQKNKKKKKVYRNRQAVPQQCRPWCPRDTNPCDPPDFKIADGRCDWRDEFW